MLHSMFMQFKYQWSYWTWSKVSVSVCVLWTTCVYVTCCL